MLDAANVMEPDRSHLFPCAQCGDALVAPEWSSAAFGIFGRARRADTSSRPQSICAPRRDGDRERMVA